ncbi:MAG: hypothetical protein US60_C0032G0011 [Microgenomates group bacterium GW2011_GWC1_37_8]|uniref:Type IV pilus assembly protein PilO n=1 Tax=Candidatus Woesebacteria bacterium GW2011_GWB1_38_8 TaxID=1618570 RepID=A0A0G0KZV7_9BACT|nr:MAG: hypothetical protein US60_C0032G0011 [Microgenomates group bacterium GW2011_GWC1_37_8]KKQ85218.1 MAG: hypothetical protein UT08_C0009G0052 [Candidatus Woesebacteria bacterium GW2011_GWB1_38_8]
MAAKATKSEKYIDKYLTQMKELPPEENEKTPSLPPVRKIPPEKVIAKPEVAKPLPKVQDNILLLEEDTEETKRKLPLALKDMILGIINLILVILLVIILLRFPDKAKELKDIRIDAIKNEESVSYQFDKIASAKVKADELSSLFVNDSGVVDFVNDLEKIKNENGTIKSITFANQQAIKDKTGSFGIPVVIELQGSWEKIDSDLQRIDGLPYLFRAAKVEAGKPKVQPGVKLEEEQEIDENIIVFKYGIFLYYDENSVGKNR